jgi:Zn-dependent protease with chaperone function
MSAIELAAAGVAPAALLAPHLLRLDRAGPPAAIAVWLLGLALRGLMAVGLAVFALIELSHVPPVEAALAWCWHVILPDLPHALGFAEHPVSHAAVAVPAGVLTASVLWLGITLTRSAFDLRRQLASALGPGPLGSTVIADERLVVAVSGLGRARVIVSERALRELDDEELAAGLVHEIGHVRRRHRPLLLVAELLAAVAWPLPGTRAALRELRFHVERDADRYTVRQLHDPLSLASAICKVAGARPAGAFAGLGGRGRVGRRLEQLLDGPEARSRAVEGGAWALAAALLAAFALLVAAAPGWAGSAAAESRVHDSHSCSHEL